MAAVGEEHGSRAWTLGLAAKVVLARGLHGADQASALYREALTLAEALEMRPLVAHCHLGLGKLYRAVGRSDQAQAELSKTIAMLSQMGMALWLPEADAELAQAVAATSAR